MFTSDIFQNKCDNCGEITQEPFIECCECEAILCTTCFASGREVNDHKNYHKYAVRANDFFVFEGCNWTAKEEARLLQGISSHGYGNWEEISKFVHTRTELECQEHYKKYYIENVQYKELNLFPETVQSIFPRPVIPYLFSTNVSKDPPRNNTSDQHLAGYNAYRSEFELSYDNYAEAIFSIENNCANEDDECMESLQVAIFKAFNNRLRERQRRYNIIKEHGLIMPNKLISWLHSIDIPALRQKVDKLLPFMQLMTGMQFQAFIESICLEFQLIQRISQLHEFRRKGIKTLYGGQLYKALKLNNDITVQEQKQRTTLMSKKFENHVNLRNMSMIGQRKKRVLMPLDIIDLPDYNLLSQKEKDLCSNIRLIPQNYLEIKRLFMLENDKLGSLKLLDARRIAKIDVNKTRKIYDFLVKEGFVKQPL